MAFLFIDLMKDYSSVNEGHFAVHLWRKNLMMHCCIEVETSETDETNVYRIKTDIPFSFSFDSSKILRT